MKTEFLEGLGLEKDVIDKIMAENGKDINAAKKAGEPDLQKELTTTKEELKQTKEQLETANTTIDGFKDYDDIKTQVADYKAKYEQAEADKQKIQDDYAFNSKLEAAAKKAGARAMKAVTPFMDMEALKTSKNQDADIEKAFEDLKAGEETKFLFAADEPIDNPTAPLGSGGGKASPLDAVAKAMGLSESDMK